MPSIIHAADGRFAAIDGAVAAPLRSVWAGLCGNLADLNVCGCRSSSCVFAK